VLTVAVLAAGALVLSSCDWPQFRLGPEHSGYSTTESAIGVGNIGTLVEKWTATTGGAVHSSPSVVNGVVYVGSEDGKLYAFDATGGSLLWTGTTGGAVDSSPAVVNGVVYVGSWDANLYAFDANGTIHCSGTPKTCAPLWTAPTGGPIAGSSPAVANGVVYLSSRDTKLYAFDANGAINCSGTPKTCAPLWTAPTGVIAAAPVGVDSSPAVANGVVYIGAVGGVSFSIGFGGSVGFAVDFLVAFDAGGNINCSGTPKTCTPLWTSNYAIGQSQSSPAVVNGVVYIGSGSGVGAGNLYGYDAAGTTGCSGTPKTCAPVWDGTAGSFDYSSPAVTNGKVYVGSADGRLQAFDTTGTTGCSGTPTTCSPLWTATTGAAVNSSPAVVNGVVYVGSGDQNLYAFDATSGVKLWSSTTGGSVDSSPAVANGIVYVGSADGKLYAFGLP
jgi:outer membrane protein assembly factor BamB